MTARNDSDRQDATASIGAAIRRHAEAYPHRPAIVSTDVEYSYKLLFERIEETGIKLRRCGFDRKARIVVALSDSQQTAVTIVAISSFAISLPLDPTLTRHEAEKYLAFVEPSGVLIRKGEDSFALQVAKERGLPVIELVDDRKGGLIIDFVVPEIGPPVPFDYAGGSTAAFIMRTSGTTSDAKLVPYSHLNMLTAAERLQFCYELGPSDRCLSVTPIWYAHGLQFTLFTPLLSGGSVAFPSDLHKIELATWFCRLKPTWYSAGPTMHLAVLEQVQAHPEEARLHSLRCIVSAGSLLPPNTQEGLEMYFGAPILDHYGMSETSAISTNSLRPGAFKPGTCGKPWPDTVKIADGSGGICAPGVWGEILITGPTVTSGYFKAPQLTAERFAGPWFRTGDVGSLDDDGFISLHGRTDDLINRGGEKIAPAQVEAAMLLHPAVRESAVYGLPHPRLGETVAMAVTLKSGCTAKPAELRDFLKASLPAFKVPRRINLLNELPKGNTGKILKGSLQELARNKNEPMVKPRTALEREISEVWKRLLKMDGIGIDDDFFDSGGDSLLSEQMLVEIESIFQQAVPPSALGEAYTIRGLASIVHEKRGLADELVTKPIDGAGTPFFFCHGDYGTRGIYAIALSELIEPQRNFYLLHPPRDVDENTVLTIEGMANLYVPILLEEHVEGPFQLGGYCNGGLVAVEIAKQLTAQGRKVDLVVLVESMSLNCRWPFRFAKNLISNAQRFGRSSRISQRLRRGGMLALWDLYRIVTGAYDPSTYAWSARIAWSRLGDLLSSEHKLRVKAELEVDRRTPAYLRAMANYIPPVLESEILVIVSEGSRHDPCMSADPWNSRARVVKRACVPGNHASCITTEVGALARAIRGSLR